MTKQERDELKTAKLNWRANMRGFYGNNWTKRRSSQKCEINVPNQ